MGIEGIKSIVNILKSCKNITYLNLDISVADCGSEGINIFSKGLLNCINIAILKIRLGQNYKIDQIALRIAETLKNCLNLENLNINLGQNQINIEGAKSISLILQKCQKIQSLTLDLEQFQIQFCQLNFQILYFTQTKSFFNKRLNELNKEAGIYIAQGLQNCFNATFMNISLKLIKIYFQIKANFCFNEIGLKKGKDVKSITDSLLQCQKITNLSLDLGCNFIGVEGAKNISRIIQKCCSIKYLKLNLRNNNIGTHGHERIVKALSKCQNIIYLCIRMGRKEYPKSLEDIQYLQSVEIKNCDNIWNQYRIFCLTILIIQRNKPKSGLRKNNSRYLTNGILSYPLIYLTSMVKRMYLRFVFFIAQGKLNQKKYVELQEEILLEQKKIFQQDEVRPHTSNLICELFEQQEVAISDWPCKSPDLILIEGVYLVNNQRFTMAKLR
ncbi:hypothetical protein ABPG72_019783 [Tetrahymena utriculariae]